MKSPTSIRFLLVLSLLAPPLARGEEESPPAAVRRLSADIASGDRRKAESAHRELERLSFAAGRPGADAERKALASALLEEASRGDLSVDARARLLAALELIGRGEVVPGLAKLLAAGNPPLVQEGARRALEANPHVNAKRALREALSGADPALRVALIASIGARKDPLATGPLIEAAADPSPEVKLAALDALSRIGDISAVPVIEGALKELAGPDRAAAERAYLRLAESLVRSKERGAARRIYDRALGMGRTAKCAALIGIGQAALQNATPKVVEALEDPDPQVRGAALETAAIMPGDAMTKALVGLIDKADADGARRSDLLEVLARRTDPESRERVLAAAEKDADEAFRARALGLLVRAARTGELDASSSRRALQAGVASLRGSKACREAAEELLIALPGEEAGQVLASLIAEAGTAETRAALLATLAARGDRRGLAAAHAAAKDSDPAVRSAALDAIGRLGDASDALTLIEALRGEPGPRAAAERALGRLKGEGVDGILVQASKDEAGAARASVIRALGSRGADASAAVIESAAKDADPGVRVAALDALGRKARKSGLPIVLAALDSPAEAEKTAAVSACLRIADGMARDERDEAAKVYLKALGAGATEDQLRSAIEGLGETAGPEALDALGSLMREGSARGALGQDAMGRLRREAGRAALRVAEKLPEESRDRAKDIYARILELRPDRATARQAARRLRRLGVDIDIGGQDGFVTRWWVLGPIPNPENALWGKRLGPEGGVDPAKPMEIEGSAYRWRAHDAPDGILSLGEVGYSAERAIAYLFAEIVVPPGDALFKLGSDDYVACFLNGEKVHEHKGKRGLSADQDTVRVKLREGKNAVLLEVGNQGSDWGACLRITDLDGKPIPPRQGIAEPAAR